MGIFRTLLIIILIFAIIRFVFRVIFPLVLRSYIRKKGREWREKMQAGKRKPPKKEGEISIDYVPKKGRKKDEDMRGEYVDYEEVD